jgi:hypothetical protein
MDYDVIVIGSGFGSSLRTNISLPLWINNAFNSHLCLTVS